MTNKEEIKNAIQAIRDMNEITNYNWDSSCVLAIEALEKQIPKKPIMLETEDYACPICGKFLIPTYPCECGQKIDWGDE